MTPLSFVIELNFKFVSIKFAALPPTPRLITFVSEIKLDYLDLCLKLSLCHLNSLNFIFRLCRCFKGLKKTQKKKGLMKQNISIWSSVKRLPLSHHTATAYGADVLIHFKSFSITRYTTACIYYTHTGEEKIQSQSAF